MDIVNKSKYVLDPISYHWECFGQGYEKMVILYSDWDIVTSASENPIEYPNITISLR